MYNSVNKSCTVDMLHISLPSRVKDLELSMALITFQIFLGETKYFLKYYLAKLVNFIQQFYSIKVRVQCVSNLKKSFSRSS